MAHLFEEVRPAGHAPQTPEQLRAWDHLGKVFGRRPSSIRSLPEHGRKKEVCIVKLEMSWATSFDFICVDGLLVGIPPKK